MEGRARHAGLPTALSTMKATPQTHVAPGCALDGGFRARRALVGTAGQGRPAPPCITAPHHSLVLPWATPAVVPGLVVLLPCWLLADGFCTTWPDWLDPSRPSLRLREVRQVLNSSENFW